MANIFFNVVESDLTSWYLYRSQTFISTSISVDTKRREINKFEVKLIIYVATRNISVVKARLIYCFSVSGSPEDSPKFCFSLFRNCLVNCKNS